MLVVEGLTCRFGTKAAVDNASFSIAPGGFVGVIGRSGAGKSTLLRMINRLAEPTEGRILFEGVDVTALRGRELRQWRARSAMIFQQFNLVGRLDVLTNVLMGRLAEIPSWRSLAQLWPEQDRALAMSALEQFDMASLAAQRADQLSGGQQQRVAIARALVQEPDIILADEPIASLDPRNTRIVMDALLRINKHFGITVICNLHSLDLARTYCDRLIGMASGRVVFDGAPATLTDHIARELYDLEANEVMGGAPADVPAGCSHSGSRHRRRGLSIRDRPSAAVASLQRRQRLSTTKRDDHDQSSYRSCRRSGAGVHRIRRVCRGLEGEISGNHLRGDPGRERLGRDRALHAVRGLSVEGTRHQGQSARRQRLCRRDRGPARRQHPDRLLRPGVVLARASHRRQDRRLRDRRQFRRLQGLLFGVLRAGQEPVPEARGSEGQEPRPGRSQLDLRQQHAALQDEPDGHRSRYLFLAGGLHRQPRERGAGAGAGHRRCLPPTGGTRTTIPT